jgi:hypothetical protein
MMQRDDFELRKKAMARQEAYICQTLGETSATHEDIQLHQEILQERYRDPELIEQRRRVKEMFRQWLSSPNLALGQSLSQPLTPRNIADLYSDIPNMALLLIQPELKEFEDLLGNRLEAFNQVVFDRHPFYLSKAVQLSAQLNEYVPSPMLKQTQTFKKLAIAESKGLAAVQELFSQNGHDTGFPGDGRMAWLVYCLSQEADHLIRILLNPAPVAKQESIASALKTLDAFDEAVKGNRSLIAPSQESQQETLEILKTHKKFALHVETVEKWAARFASESPDYDRLFFSPWNRARQIALNEIGKSENSGKWKTQWINRQGERQESKRGQKVTSRKVKGKGFGNL